MKLRTFSASFRSSPSAWVPVAGQRGFSMIEVLISIVVLSFGLLGSVGLQSFAIKSNREGRLQSVATTLAREYAEMMRGNKYIGVEPTAAKNPYLLDDKTIKALSDLPTAWAYCLHTGCEDTTALAANAQNTAIQTKVAQSEVLEWMARALDELPGAWVRVCADVAPFDSSGLPQWACTAPTGGATLDNMTVVIKMGWTQSAISRGQTGDAALQKADTRPTLVFPVISGNSQ